MDPIDAINDGFRQSAHADEIKQRRADQSDNRSPEQKDTADLLRRIAALESWRSNLKGRNGIRVEDGEIVFQGRKEQITATAVCNEDGTITITINN